MNLNVILYFFIYVFLLVIIGLSAWNICLFRKIKSHIEVKNKIEEKNLYFDLKYRLQFIMTIAAIVVAMITFFGYNQFTKIENDFEELINSKFEQYNDNYDELAETNLSMNKLIEDSEKRIKDIGAKINIISQDVLYGNLFIVENLFLNLKDFKLGKEIIQKKYYYKDLLTNNQNTLPKFNKAPSINIIPTTGAVISLSDNTNEYFEIELQSCNEDSMFFEVWIISDASNIK
ncbi:MAG: hypothetical protein KAH05_07365 [Clostridiales bacterium]|nr:hypothetical protein [Clostridiales bacterium]